MTKKLSELKESIVKNSEERAETIRSRAEKVKERTIRTSKRKADRILRNAEKSAEDDFEREKRKIKYDLEINSRKKKLTIEQRIIDDLKNELEERLINLFDNRKLDEWIKNQIKEIVRDSIEQFVLRCNSDHQKKYKELCADIDIEVKSDDIKPGFLLKSEKDEYDFTFETLAENLVESGKEEILKDLQVAGENNG
ncbi:MAG: V-type ATP synthase subunit E [Candidatus Marinimicrobia bacterium]|nr:V-type ATP synthase subunit E [Candidatus Neomarinimicrobiota bacterium]